MYHCKAVGSVLFCQTSLTSFHAEDGDVLCHPLKSVETSPEIFACVCHKDPSLILQRYFTFQARLLSAVKELKYLFPCGYLHIHW